MSEQLEQIVTDDDLAARRACLAAEAEGDAELALEHYGRGLQVHGSLHPHQMLEVVRWGDAAPGWGIDRWARVQAYRWMLDTEDPRVTDALIETLAAAYADVDPEQPLGWDPSEFGTRLAAGDWICEQLSLYELGGLADFLEVRAGEGLLRRVDRVHDWVPAAVTGYTLDGFVGDRIRVTRLADGAPLEVLNLGALSDRSHERPVPVLGRIVPITEEPGLMFDVRPLEVDLATAQDAADLWVAGHDLGWLYAISEGRDGGRLEVLFSAVGSTPLGSDLQPERPSPPGERRDLAPGLQKLVDDGWSVDQANGVGVCEVALMAVEMSGAEIAPVMGTHVTAVLAREDVVDAVRAHCTEPRREEHWRMLAACVPEPVRTRCLELAVRCRAAA